MRETRKPTVDCTGDLSEVVIVDASVTLRDKAGGFSKAHDGKCPWLLYYTSPDPDAPPFILTRRIESEAGVVDVDLPLVFALRLPPFHNGISADPSVTGDDLQDICGPTPIGWSRVIISSEQFLSRVEWLEQQTLVSYDCPAGSYSGDWLSFPRMYLCDGRKELDAFLDKHYPHQTRIYRLQGERNRLEHEISQLDETWMENRLAAIGMRQRIATIDAEIKELRWRELMKFIKGNPS